MGRWLRRAWSWIRSHSRRLLGWINTGIGLIGLLIFELVYFPLCITVSFIEKSLMLAKSFLIGIGCILLWIFHQHGENRSDGNKFWIGIFFLLLFLIGSVLWHTAGEFPEYNFGIRVYDTSMVPDGKSSSIQAKDLILDGPLVFFDFRKYEGSISFNWDISNNLGSINIDFPKEIRVTKVILSNDTLNKSNPKSHFFEENKDFIIEPGWCLNCKAFRLHRKDGEQMGALGLRSVIIQFSGKIIPYGIFTLTPENNIINSNTKNPFIDFYLGNYVCEDPCLVPISIDGENLIPDKTSDGHLQLKKSISKIDYEAFDLRAYNWEEQQRNKAEENKKQRIEALLISVMAGLLFFILQLIFYKPYLAR